MSGLELTSARTRWQCAVASTSGRPSMCHPRSFAYGISHQTPRQAPFQTTLTSPNHFVTHAASDVTDSADTSDITDGEWVEVGVVGPPHGVRGEFKCQPLTDFPEERLGEPGPRWLQAPVPKIASLAAPSEPAPVELEWGRTTIFKGRELWIVKLEGIDSPEEAELYRNHLLLIPAADREPLDDEDEFYVQELVGLKVFMATTGEEVGKVVDLFDGTGTHDVLRIELSQEFCIQLQNDENKRADDESKAAEEAQPSGPRQVMLPFVKALVPIVDLAGGVMKIDPPEGLFELAVEVQVKEKRKENAGKKERRRPRGSGPTSTGGPEVNTSRGFLSAD